MQISSKNLSKQEEKQIHDQFITLLSDLQNPQTFTTFANDFFTDTEKLVFAKRLAIAWLLHQGKSYQEIKDQLKVSSATISSVAEIKNNPGILIATEKIKTDKKFDQAAAKITQIFEKLKIGQ